jgi:hypothetical protein
VWSFDAQGIIVSGQRANATVQAVYTAGVYEVWEFPAAHCLVRVIEDTPDSRSKVLDWIEAEDQDRACRLLVAQCDRLEEATAWRVGAKVLIGGVFWKIVAKELPLDEPYWQIAPADCNEFEALQLQQSWAESLLREHVEQAILFPQIPCHLTWQHIKMFVDSLSHDGVMLCDYALHTNPDDLVYGQPQTHEVAVFAIPNCNEWHLHIAPMIFVEGITNWVLGDGIVVQARSLEIAEQIMCQVRRFLDGDKGGL